MPVWPPSGGGPEVQGTRLTAEKKMRCDEATTTYLRGRVARGELRPASESAYRARLDHLCASVGPDRDVGSLRRRHVERWLEHLGVWAPSTRRAYFATGRVFMRWCVDEGLLAADPTKGVAAPREPRTSPRNLPRDSVCDLLDACTPRQRIVAMLMLHVGLRRGEVARLEVEDVDLAGRVLRVDGKGGHERVLPIPDQLAAELGRWLAGNRWRHGPVIRSERTGRALTPGTVGTLMSTALYAAGVKRGGWDRISGHSLRHSAAADMLRSGAHVRDVQAVLGHRSIATTERYLPLVVGTLGQAVEGRRY